MVFFGEATSTETYRVGARNPPRSLGPRPLHGPGSARLAEGEAGNGLYQRAEISANHDRKGHGSPKRNPAGARL